MAKLNQRLIKPDTVAKVRELHESGLPVESIAAQVGRGILEVQNLINEFTAWKKADRLIKTETELHDLEKKIIRDFYRDGQSYVLIARYLDRDKQVVFDYLKSLGYDVKVDGTYHAKTRYLSEEEKQILVREHLAGESIKGLVRKYNRHRKTIRSVLQSANIAV